MTHEQLVKEVLDRVQDRIAQAESQQSGVADLSKEKFVSLSKIRTAHLKGYKAIILNSSAIVTDEALSYVKTHGIVVEK